MIPESPYKTTIHGDESHLRVPDEYAIAESFDGGDVDRQLPMLALPQELLLALVIHSQHGP